MLLVVEVCKLTERCDPPCSSLWETNLLFPKVLVLLVVEVCESTKRHDPSLFTLGN